MIGPWLAHFELDRAVAVLGGPERVAALLDAAELHGAPTVTDLPSGHPLVPKAVAALAETADCTNLRTRHPCTQSEARPGSPQPPQRDLPPIGITDPGGSTGAALRPTTAGNPVADDPQHHRYQVILSTDDGVTVETELFALDAPDAIACAAYGVRLREARDGNGNDHATITRAMARRVPD